MAAARRNHRRRRSRGRFGPLLKLLCILAVAAALTLGVTVFFRVETVVVTGNTRYTQEEIVAASQIQTGDNLYALNKNQISQRLRETLPYIGEVSIRRSLPSTILITVTEWSAVAKVEPPASGWAQAEETSGQDGDTEETTEEAQAEEPQNETLGAARAAWLINVGGKLLEPAPADSTALSVTGLTPIIPRAGTKLAVRQEEQFKLDALLGLLEELEEMGMRQDVSSICLEETQAVLEYLGRYTVKIPINADFHYKLQVLSTVVQLQEDTSTGTLDLTQEGATAVYSPG